jgi:hypothetical protein
VIGYFSREDRNRPIAEDDPPGDQAVNHVFNARSKPPVYEHGRLGVTVWIDNVEQWIVTSGLTLDIFRRRYLLQCFPEPVIRDWAIKIGTQYSTWADWTNAFRAAWRDRELEEKLGQQASTVRQADGEDILAFVLKKQAQFEYYCPELSEGQRAEVTLRLMLPRYSQFFTGEYLSMLHVITDAPAVKQRVGFSARGKTPRSYSLDPHVVVAIDEEPKAFKRPAQSQFPVRKRTTEGPKQAPSANVAGKNPRPFPPPAAKVVPAGQKTSRPPKPGGQPPRKVNAADLRCFKCQGTGHFARDCPNPASREKTSRMVSMIKTLMLENNQDPEKLDWCQEEESPLDWYKDDDQNRSES